MCSSDVCVRFRFLGMRPAFWTSGSWTEVMVFFFSFSLPMASSAASWARRNLFSNRSKTSARIGNLIAESFAQ